MLTERGLGGDSVDLDVRLDQFRRDRSNAPPARATWRERWAAQVAADATASGAEQPPTAKSSTGVMLAFAFPDRVARNRGNGSFVLANGRGAAVEQASALARAPYIAVGELTGTAAERAHPAGGADHAGRNRSALRRPDRDRRRDGSFDRGAMALRARRRRTLHAITLPEAPLALTPSERDRAVLADG